MSQKTGYTLSRSGETHLRVIFLELLLYVKGKKFYSQCFVFCKICTNSINLKRFVESTPEIL